MIKSIELTKQKKNFTNKLYNYKDGKKVFSFTDGINVITGRNGSGKSVLLKMLSLSCGIKDRTYPSMPAPFDLHPLFSDEYHTMDQGIKKWIKKSGYPATKIDWDGRMVHYLTQEFFDPKDMFDRIMNPMPGLEGKELFETGEVLQSFMSNLSKGEGSIQLLLKLYKLHDTYESPRQGGNSVWQRTSDEFQNWLNSFPQEKGKPTLLIDELDGSLDLDNQKVYWDFIKHLTSKWQVIVVSHSIFAFKQKDVNHIPLNPTYFRYINKLSL